MARFLSESAWTGFLKKQKLELEDKLLVKALSVLDKSDESKPEPRLKALDEVIKQIPEQIKALVKRKKELGDKPFGLAKDQLNAMLDEAESLRKEVEASSDSDEEADSPALLTTKMVPVLREVRRGQVTMHAMICMAGKATAVLIARRPISPARRKLLAEAVNATGGMKYLVAECLLEEKALTFVVKSPAAQLAKRLRQALLDQLGMRVKVRVRGDDGVEEDGEDEGEPADQPDGQRIASSEGQAAPKPPGDAPTPEQLAYSQRLRKVRDRYDEALASRHPESTKLRALMGFASEKAEEKKDYASAGKALDMVDKLLSAPTGSDPRVAEAAMAALTERFQALSVQLMDLKAYGGPAGAAIQARVDGARKALDTGDGRGATKMIDGLGQLVQALQARQANKAPAGSDQPGDSTEAPDSGELVAYRKLLLEWDAAKKNATAQLSTLRERLVADFPEWADRAKLLDQVMKRFNEGLADTLDALLNAPTAAQRTRDQDRAARIAKRYFVRLNADPLFKLVDENPLAAVSVRATLAAPLKKLLTALAD